MNIEDLKIHTKFCIDGESNVDVVYNTYFNITSTPIENSIRELFEIKGLKSENDFNHFLSRVMYDPENKRYVDDSLKILTDIKDGKFLDQCFLESSKDKVSNLRDFVDERFSTSALLNLVNYIPTGWSGSSVGRGEFAFIVLGDGCIKAKRGGDLNLKGLDIEVKGNGAKMASQNSHNSLQSTMIYAKEVLNKLHHRDETYEVKTINKLNVFGYYLPIFNNNAITLCTFLSTVFNLAMHKCTEEELHWIFDCVDVENEFDWEVFRKKMAVFEFNYYKKCDHFDRILFINNKNLNMMNVDEMSIDKLDSFRLDSPQYRFNTERIITTYWELK